MIVGRMNRRVILQEPIKTPDGMGGSKPGWSIGIGVWAEFRMPNVKEMAATGTIISDLVQQISIRRRRDVRRGWRLVWGDRMYHIQDVFDPDRETTILVCQEVEI